MQKDFDRWNESKKIIHSVKTNKVYHERHIWWCSLGVNIGFEQDGSGLDYLRPVLILKGLSLQTCLIVPLTSSNQKHKLRIPVGLIAEKEASAILSQIRVVDTKRFVEKIGFLTPEIFEQVRKAVRDFL
ncbi:MAG: type II toxin-antitoxin system PemK/MazF family toxin [Patescibacteria group bacterium]